VQIDFGIIVLKLIIYGLKLDAFNHLVNTIAAFQKTGASGSCFVLEKCIGSSFAHIFLKRSRRMPGEEFRLFIFSAHPSTSYYAFLQLLAGL
jgi:hypothetical protein